MEQTMSLPHDIKPLTPYVWGVFEWSLVLATLLFLVLLAFAMRWAWRHWRLLKERQVPALTPFQRLMAKLQELKPDADKEYYLELSMIMREYLETFFRIRTTDMTVQEILKFLPMYLPLKFSEQSALRNFFLRVEEVVFAGKASTLPEASEWHQKVEAWIGQLEELRTEVANQAKPQVASAFGQKKERAK